MWELSLLWISRWFGGLFLDIKRKAPHYLSDYTDAFSLQCVASFLFLYCACMSPVITFGGLLGEATEGRIVNPVAFPRNVHGVLPSLAVHCCKMCCSLSILNHLTVIVQYGAGFFFFFKQTSNNRTVFSHFPECNWVTVWSLTDWNSLLPVCRPAPHHSRQHGASSCVWEDIVQILQVGFYFSHNVTCINNLSKDSSFIHSTHYISSRLHWLEWCGINLWMDHAWNIWPPCRSFSMDHVV